MTNQINISISNLPNEERNSLFSFLVSIDYDFSYSAGIVSLPILEGSDQLGMLMQINRFKYSEHLIFVEL